MPRYVHIAMTIAPPLSLMMMVMRSRPKLRTFCHWMLTILTVVLVVVWIGSGWYSVGCAPQWTQSDSATMLMIHFACGNCTAWIGNVETGDLNLPDALWINRLPSTFRFRLWEWYGDDASSKFYASFPAWLPPLLLAIPTALMWRTHLINRRRPPGMCNKCGYDITGLVGIEKCPECGTTLKGEISKAMA